MHSAADLIAVLATIGDRDLESLSAAIEHSPNAVPGLLAWVEAAIDWEINRRAGVEYPLLSPREAISDTETDASLMTLMLLAVCFRSDGRPESKPIVEFLELTASTLRAQIERPSRLQ